MILDAALIIAAYSTRFQPAPRRSKHGFCGFETALRENQVFRRLRTALRARVHLFARFRSAEERDFDCQGPGQKRRRAKAKRDLLERFVKSIYRCDSTVKAATA